MNLAPATPPAVTPEASQPYQFSTEDFLRLLEAEVLPDEVRVELWDGQVIEKMAKSIPHPTSGMKVLAALARLVPRGWALSSENPVAINPRSTPLPDFSMVRGSGDDYATRSVVAGDVGLIVEVSLTSLNKDRTTRAADFARAGIPAYWVINLIDQVLLVFERPAAGEGRYQSSQTVALSQSVPLRLDGVLVAEIPAVDLLPSPR